MHNINAAVPNHGGPNSVTIAGWSFDRDEVMLRDRKFWQAALGVSSSTLWRAYRSGALEGTRIGGRLLHSPPQVARWLEAEQQRGGPEPVEDGAE